MAMEHSDDVYQYLPCLPIGETQLGSVGELKDELVVLHPPHIVLTRPPPQQDATDIGDLIACNALVVVDCKEKK